VTVWKEFTFSTCREAFAVHRPARPPPIDEPTAALMVGAGLVTGGLLSIWATRALSSVVSATDHFDLPSVAVAAVVLIVAGAGAVLPAARRAVRTDPLIALRSE
jgi:ABC-type antimicrobial peptide transport system permease subunit